MAICTVDVKPQSPVGVTCGRLIREDQCPVHGYMTQPSVFEHDEPTHTQMVASEP